MDQKAEKDSTNYQAHTINISGLTYAEVKDIAMDVFKNNFEKLSDDAANTAFIRAKEITEKFLNKLMENNPKGLELAKDPDFQCSYYEMQKAYARTGDKDLEALLVDLMVDRSRQTQRNILQIVLNEALLTAPKLTNNHLASLAIIFILRYVEKGIFDFNGLGLYFEQHIFPFLPSLKVNDTLCYQHLEFTGCGSIGITVYALESIFSDVFSGLFNHGFDESVISNRSITIGKNSEFFIPCLNDVTKLQVNAQNLKALKNLFDIFKISSNDRNQIEWLFENNKFSAQEVKDKCISIRPYMQQLFDIWSSSPMQNVTLTSVGIAIGHANIQRHVGKFADLSLWIN
ncbi:MAG: hypothetical protein K2P52_09875 [Campylobacterales bacterium]|nr:hypothetical protein [Campylobacterales bacterium]